MIIDAHAHVTGPIEMYEHFRGFTNVPGASGLRLRKFQVSDDQLEASLAPHFAEVDAVGTQLQLIAPRPWAVPTAERRTHLIYSITQQVNDLVAQCVKLHPDRFAGIAALPQSPALSPKDTAEEIDRCVNDLGFVGIKINPDPGEGGTLVPEMGSEYWYPLYEKMVELDVPGLIHGGPFRFSREPEMGYFCEEESVAGWSLLRTLEVFRDFPNLKIIIGHGGGYIPYQYGRARTSVINDRKKEVSASGTGAMVWSNRNSATTDEVPEISEELWEPFETTLRRLYFDTVLFDQNSLEFLLKVVGVDRCLFGSDRPANGSVIDPHTGRSLNDVKPLIDNIDWLTDSDRKAIYEDNARKVYTRLKV